MNTAKTLVASYCFPPYNDTAAIVAAKRVREAGEPADVICNAMDSIRRKDPSLVQVSGALVRRLGALRTPTAFSSWRSISQFALVGLETARRWQAEQGPYEKLYSRAQFAASHFLGARLKGENPEIRWQAEFSDPLSHDVEGNVRAIQMDPSSPLIPEYRQLIETAGFATPTTMNGFEWCEQLVFTLADEIIFTNPRQMEFMVSMIEDPKVAERVRAVAVVSPHPTLPREFYDKVNSTYEVPRGVTNIGYFGNFYANRGVDTVLDALTELPHEARSRICLHLFTSGASMAALNEEVARRQIQGSVRINPYVGFLEHLNLADRMDVLLVNDALSPEGAVNPFLPSKISDYRGSVKPVWAILEEGSPMDSLDHSVIRYRSPINHLSAIRQQLAAFAAQAREGSN